MASRNPFGNLNINRDDDDEDFVKVTPKNSTSASNYTSHTEMKSEMKKKKKVRPDENKKDEEYVQESSEGFEVVGKIKKPFTSTNANIEGGDEKKNNKEKKYKGTGNHSNVENKTRPQKRQYERHSGTGRGKETSKNGAGGKTVWGDNTEQIARQARKEGGRDDYFFDSVLNPKKENVVEQVEEAKETVVEATPVVEETQEKPSEQNWERKRKEIVEEEIPLEERMDRPEGALSLADYRESMKEKNKKISGAGKAQTLNVKLPSDLQVIEKETIVVKEKKTGKAKKVDNSVQQIAVDFKTEDLSNANAPRYQKEYPQKEQTKKPVNKAKINFDNLPSL